MARGKKSKRLRVAQAKHTAIITGQTEPASSLQLTQASPTPSNCQIPDLYGDLSSADEDEEDSHAPPTPGGSDAEDEYVNQSSLVDAPDVRAGQLDGIPKSLALLCVEDDDETHESARDPASQSDPEEAGILRYLACRPQDTNDDDETAALVSGIDLPVRSLNEAYDALQLPLLPSQGASTRDLFIQLTVQFVFQTYDGLNHFQQAGEVGYDAVTLAASFSAHYISAIWGAQALTGVSAEKWLVRLEHFFDALRTRSFMRGGTTSTLNELLARLTGPREATTKDPVSLGDVDATEDNEDAGGVTIDNHKLHVNMNGHPLTSDSAPPFDYPSRFVATKRRAVRAATVVHRPDNFRQTAPRRSNHLATVINIQPPSNATSGGNDPLLQGDKEEDLSEEALADQSLAAALATLYESYEDLKLPDLPSVDGKTQDRFVDLAVSFVFDTYNWLFDFHTSLPTAGDLYDEELLAQAFYHNFGPALWGADVAGDASHEYRTSFLQRFFVALRELGFTRPTTEVPIRRLLVELVGLQRVAAAAYELHAISRSENTGDAVNSTHALFGLFLALATQRGQADTSVETLFRDAVAQIAFEAMDNVQNAPLAAFGVHLPRPSPEVVTEIISRVRNRYADILWPDLESLPEWLVKNLQNYILALMEVSTTRADVGRNAVRKLDDLLDLKSGNQEEKSNERSKKTCDDISAESGLKCTLDYLEKHPTCLHNFATLDDVKEYMIQVHGFDKELARESASDSAYALKKRSRKP